MTDRVRDIGGIAVLVCADRGPQLQGVADALDLIGLAGVEGAALIQLPASRLDPAFFDLASGIAGEFLQKLVNYGQRLAIVGDISGHTGRSRALRDFVRECNRGTQIWFVADERALVTRLTGATTDP